MMGEHQPLTSPGSDYSRRSPPERCPRPLYSQDCPEEKLPENHQVLTPEKSPREMSLSSVFPGLSRGEAPREPSGSDSSRRNPPKRCPRPLYPQDCREEKLPENHQNSSSVHKMASRYKMDSNLSHV
ncbi:uncharacterized protein LOC122935876 isoform X5 [Bufo gargarizans]|uniref:uncharacterized protein LOC122935876 isoform X5 n=1 Tax=Bufo gargarizans TaxID=30331 RepID=UPI001CF36555|nr:uncharacterized protein LOC122935876 isoform X5 [Bufo gargarizans]XP_044147731.1 uncharacterized protein LOC122935876 isoform X5 [Bufo gargarizans]